MVTAVEGSYVNLAYKTTDSAKAAVADDNKVKVLNSVVNVRLQKEKNNKTYTGLHIRNLVHKTSEEQLKEHFKSCGEIEQVKVVEKAKKTFAFVVFKNETSEVEALKLHNSVLNGVNIIVVKNDPAFSEAKWVDRYEENRTVVVKNKQSFENLDCAQVNKLQQVFAKYGEIERMDVLCREHTLAMVIYKNEADAQKAFELNNKTVNDFEIELQSFEKKGFINNNTTIFVSNLPNNCTEKDLRNVFSKAGEITSVLLKHGCATIRFADIDSYCRSFVYNESIINRKMIFVEPYSIRKHLKMKSKKTGKGGFKRGAGKGNQGPKAKKPKTK